MEGRYTAANTERLRFMDAHIHLDGYGPEQRPLLEQSLEAEELDGVIAVSMDAASCREVQRWAERYPGRVHPAYGFHPEQPLPSEQERSALLQWMDERRDAMIAIGEVGLPYYMRQEALRAGGSEAAFPRGAYLELLEAFVQRAAAWDKPLVLHAVYDDTPLVIDLLERYSVRTAHFHWFKGDVKTTDRMAGNGYYISFTPDLAYEGEIRELALRYPADCVMTETDGPWPFEGPFAGQVTLPLMVRDVAASWAALQRLEFGEAAALLRANAKRCYGV
ncbi:TatD family hydrolase [Paenibacillus thiaminolyticus]|uniref:TatD family hydrolase n=1 Tax=Paenibacillus thiaminolyticus TaxID=49283 RepID=UPI0025436BF5|nr:TatD family hydrolase [Paenibacillus thiaminolyticus]WII37357.1 TatD family hydrolase [Paenibacillus thiaminolyticus]